MSIPGYQERTLHPPSCILEKADSNRFILKEASSLFLMLFRLEPSCIGLFADELFEQPFSQKLQAISPPARTHFEQYLFGEPQNVMAHLKITPGGTTVFCLCQQPQTIAKRPQDAALDPVLPNVPFPLCLCHVPKDHSVHIHCETPEFRKLCQSHHIEVRQLITDSLRRDEFRRNHSVSRFILLPDKESGIRQQFLMLFFPWHYIGGTDECDHFISLFLPIHEQEQCQRLSILTPREAQIAEQAAAGMPNRAIAASLHISEGTVKRTLSNVYQKLEISSRQELPHI